MAIETTIGGAVSVSRVKQLKCAKTKIYANLLSSGENQHEKISLESNINDERSEHDEQMKVQMDQGVGK